MKKLVVKALEGAAVIIALIVGFLLMNTISVESMLRGKEEPATLAMTEDGLQEDFIGLPAGDDIPRVTSLQEWEDTWATSCITIEPLSVIPTGIGARYSWVGAYSNVGRRGGARKKADVTRTAFDIMGEYGEYFILQLPDQSYILAQISKDDARKLKAGKEITLPVGKKDGVHRQVLANIQDLCDEYNVNTDGVFYCVNDQWNQSHSMMVTLIRIGIALGTTLVLGTILIMIVDKLLKVKD
ncbi:MAG: hypothetical protein HFG71_16010 [Hungatella sp.]|jgi:hypothetical protein|nr:hypothetical protein [Hungatella sp.]